ncbi:MAG: VWA domain-containing protein [Acidobacteriota bacterium]
MLKLTEKSLGLQFWRSLVPKVVPLVSVLGLAVTGGDLRGQDRDSLPTEQVSIEALDETGAVVTDLVAPSLQLYRGGSPVDVSDQGEIGDDWRVVIYLDQMLATPTDFHNGTVQLAERARDLTSLGEVEILLANRDVAVALPPTDSADALQQALGWLRLRESAEDLQAEVRQEFLEELGLEAERTEDSESTSNRELTSQQVFELAEASIATERDLLRRHREQLVLWASEHATAGPKALFLIGSGFDPQIEPFYRSTLKQNGWTELADSLLGYEIRPTLEEVGQALSIYGWTVLPYVPAESGDVLLQRTDEEKKAEKEDEAVDVIFQDGRLVDRTTIGFDPADLLRKRREKKRKQAEVPLVSSADQPFRQLADLSGGEFLEGKFQLTDVLRRLGRRHLLVLDPTAKLQLEPEEVAVKVAADAKRESDAVAVLRARRWVSQTTPLAVSRVRVQQILADELDEGSLMIAAAWQANESSTGSRLIVKKEVDDSEVGSDGPLRLTVAIAPDDDGPLDVINEVRAGWETSESLDPDESPEPVLELALESGVEGALVVLVEELDSGLWGGTFATHLEPGLTAASRGGYESLILPAPKTIHLMAPSQGFAMGRTEFETVVSRAEVSQVDFFLDGQREAVRRTPPFSATLDLGSLPQPRRVEVVALDPAGRELGRDYLIVNEGSGVFGVRIVKPEVGLDAGGKEPLVGPIDVEAEVEPRRGEGIDRVEFYWVDELIATRYAPPFRQRVLIPSDDPVGFVRVVAYLDDGASSEDVLFVNSPGSSARLQVNLMELYVVVTDRNGRPVTGLPQDLFEVEEDGEPQEIATFSDAGELPLTVGMLIDSSASMFVKLPDVRFAAAEFLRGLATRRDRAFVVGFGDQPKLTRSTTSDLPAVIESLEILKPEGQTAIWKGIVYSLVQLQGVPGKKALVVYTDGADEDPDFSYRTALKFARRVGVPIYVILSNNEIVRTEGKGLNVKSFLDRLENLTDSVGGKIFMARVGDDLNEVYRQIDEELRSQYVVGFYSRDTGGREWRPVSVDVAKAGYKARTIAGYFR